MIGFHRFSKSFDGGATHAVKNLTTEIQPGEFVAVIGPSGAGKSTFLRAINALNGPGEGEVIVLGKSVNKLKSKELRILRRDIGFVFQQFNLVKSLSTLRNVLLGRLSFLSGWRSLFGLFQKDDIQKAKAALNAVGLEGKENQRAGSLSGGQQQRVAIARALVQDPKIILADEPMASLDPKLSEVVLDILKQINEERKITVLVNIHVLDLAKKYAKRIIGLRKGELVYDGPTAGLTGDVIKRIYES